MRRPNPPLLRLLAAAFAACALGVACPPPTRAAASVDAVIEPAEITLGDSARLTVTQTGAGALSVTLPSVAGLEFRVVGRSQQIQIINGVTLETTATIIRVTPQSAGTFKIAGITPKAAPLVLRVDPAGSAVPAAPGAAPDANAPRLSADGAAFVHVVIPKHEVYVGESIPIEIEVGMRDGVVASVNGIPKLGSSDFTLNNLSHEPERRPRLIGGKPFTVLTWHSVLAAVKPGRFEVSFETPLTIRKRLGSRSDSLLDDLLGDPFMQNFFAPTVPKNIEVSSPPLAFEVKPLPAEGRPADFTGAVGTFKVDAEVSSKTNIAGDPLTLRLRIAGTGNFDRVDSRMLTGSADWKSYEPKATFKPADALGYRGEKTFEQPVVAVTAGTLSIPPLEFSYFDPQTRRYETEHTQALSVRVTPSAAQRAASGVAPAASPAANGKGRGDLRADHPLGGARYATLTPPYCRPALMAIPSMLTLLLAGAWLALRRQERLTADQALEQARRRQRLLAEMRRAAAAGDAVAYLRAARAALEQALAARSAGAASSSAQDLEPLLDAHPEGAAIRQLLALADEAFYGGRLIEGEDFERWSALVERLGAEREAG